MSLYRQILKATDGLHGWCDRGKRIALANLVLATKPQTIVEIGVWGGQSLIPMAMAAQSISNPSYRPKVIAIDPWAASESVKGQGEKDANWWGNEIGQAHHDMVYTGFIGKIHELNLRQIVDVKRQPSNDVNPPARIDLCHTDGNHGPQALTDVMRFAPSIPSGGICVLDDLNWSGGAVGAAAEWLKQNGFLELHPLGTGAVYQKL